MPAPETSGLFHRAVLWEAVPDQFDPQGNPYLLPPAVIACLWNKKRRQSIGRDGQPLALDAKARVDREITTNSLLWKSPLDETYTDAEVLDEWYGHGTGSGSAGIGTEVMRVESYSETDDVKGLNKTRRIEMMRHKDEPRFAMASAPMTAARPETVKGAKGGSRNQRGRRGHTGRRGRKPNRPAP